MDSATRIGQLFLLSCLCSSWPYVASHGVLVHPKSRNFVAYLETRDWCPHCLNAGGNGKVSGGQQWPTGRHGYCGDAYDQTKWDVAGPLQTSYVAGQDINVDFMITENHLGRIDVSLCSLDAQPGDDQCTQLTRVDGKGRYWYLPFLNNWSGGNSGVEKPAYSDGSFGWYLMPSVTSDMGCSTPSCDHYKNIVVYRTQWQLPEGFTCRRCKLQWHYFTAHNCWPPCPDQNRDEVTCENNQAYKTCGEPGAVYPEEFWNCADVSIRSKDSASRPDADAANSAPWEQQVTVSYAPYGTPRPVKMGSGVWSVMELARPSSLPRKI